MNKPQKLPLNRRGMAMRLAEVAMIEFELPETWQVIYRSLVNIPPGEPVEGIEDGSTQWENYFRQDLLQVRSLSQQRLIDVGWYPEADPNGSYILQLLPFSGGKANWDAPVEEFSTSDLDQLLGRILSITGGRAKGRWSR